MDTRERVDNSLHSLHERVDNSLHERVDNSLHERANNSVHESQQHESQQLGDQFERTWVAFEEACQPIVSWTTVTVRTVVPVVETKQFSSTVTHIDVTQLKASSLHVLCQIDCQLFIKVDHFLNNLQKLL